MTIIERIIDITSKKNIPLAALSKELNISATTISGWKRRNVDPPASTLSTIANFLGVSVLYLLGLQEDQGMPAPSSQPASNPPAPVVSRMGLTAKEEELLSIFRDLGEDSQEIVLATAYLERRAHPDKEARRGLTG